MHEARPCSDTRAPASGARCVATAPSQHVWPAARGIPGPLPDAVAPTRISSRGCQASRLAAEPLLDTGFEVKRAEATGGICLVRRAGNPAPVRRLNRRGGPPRAAARVGGH